MDRIGPRNKYGVDRLKKYGVDGLNKKEFQQEVLKSEKQAVNKIELLLTCALEVHVLLVCQFRLGGLVTCQRCVHLGQNAL